jgi:dihydrofolate reductase
VFTARAAGGAGTGRTHGADRGDRGEVEATAGTAQAATVAKHPIRASAHRVRRRVGERLTEVDMSRITAVENVTLDGVMQAPGSPDEDTRGGFEHGGWGAAYTDEVSMQVAAKGMATEGAMLFGRLTYQRFHFRWAGRDDNPFSPVLDARHKYVASRTLSEPLPWQNSTLLSGDAVTAVTELKARAPEDAIAVLGSGVLLRALLAADLVDELQLWIHPLVLGTGTRLFEAGGPRQALELSGSVVTTTGVVIATYRPAGPSQG